MFQFSYHYNEYVLDIVISHTILSVTPRPLLIYNKLISFFFT